MGSLKKVAAAAGIIFVILLAVSAYLALWTGSTKDIEAVANQFQPDESWVLVQEDIRPPKNLCLNGGTCPQLLRTWQRDENLSLSELEEEVNQSGWNLRISGDCEIGESQSGSVSLCSARGNQGAYEISIRYSSPDIKSIQPKLSLLITSQIKD